MRRSSMAVAVLLAVAACSPADPVAVEDPTTTTASEGPATGDPTTTRPGPTTTVGPYAPKEIAFTWECDQVDRPDAFAISCSDPSATGSSALEFRLGYWNTIITFDLDESEQPVAMTFGAGTYNGNCTWAVDPAGFVTVPIDDGIAAFDIVMLGDGNCDGLRFVMSGTWDLNAMGLAVDGYTEYIGS